MEWKADQVFWSLTLEKLSACGEGFHRFNSTWHQITFPFSACHTTSPTPSYFNFTFPSIHPLNQLPPNTHDITNHLDKPNPRQCSKLGIVVHQLTTLSFKYYSVTFDGNPRERCHLKSRQHKMKLPREWWYLLEWFAQQESRNLYPWANHCCCCCCSSLYFWWHMVNVRPTWC